MSPGEPVIRIRSRLKNLRDEKLEIDTLWEEAWQRRQSDLIGPADQPGSDVPSVNGAIQDKERSRVLTSSLSSGNVSPKDSKPQMKSGEKGGDRGVVRKVSHGSSGLTRRNSDKFSELEEEAYEVRGSQNDAVMFPTTFQDGCVSFPYTMHSYVSCSSIYYSSSGYS